MGSILHFQGLGAEAARPIGRRTSRDEPHAWLMLVIDGAPHV